VSAAVIDGKAVAQEWRQATAAKAAKFIKAAGRAPTLAAVLVGADPASQVYVRNKATALAEAGMRAKEFELTGVGETELLELIASLNRDPTIDGILVQLPLPAPLSADAVIAAIDPDKDVDGFHPLNAGRLAAGRPLFVPCTPLGCMKLLRRRHQALAGLDAVVIGRSGIVGRPLAALLVQADCTVTVAHSKTRDLPAVCRRADILIAAVGRPEMVRGAWIKPGATVIDVGINRVSRDGKTKLVGDVHFAEASAVAGAITPVPGGVGPMTIAALLANTLAAACRRAGVAEQTLGG
jgi:methylenetetrahydrofolate dehydrogenase (NADP+) / methenyltetrahydrofolate cyclohydrolase